MALERGFVVSVRWLGAWVSRLAWLAALAHSFASAAQELPQDARVAIVGDGLALGMEQTGFFAQMLQRAFFGRRLEVRYFAKRGATVKEAWPELDAGRRPQFAPHVVVLCLGRNDAGAGREGLPGFGEAFGKRLRGMRKAKVYVLAPIVFPEAPLWQSRQAYAEVMRGICQREGALWLDLAPGLAALRDDASEPLTWNGVDLNPYGHWVLAMLAAREMGFTGGDGGAGLEALWSVEPSPHWELEPCPGDTKPLREAPERGREKPGDAPALAVAEGYRAGIWASAENLPFGGAELMDFDARGGLYLLCREGRVIRLDDSDRNHEADQCDRFAQVTGQATGLAAAPEGLWVAHGGGLWRLRDLDGDGRADARDGMLAGFDGPGGEIRDLLWGPAGELWFTVRQERASRLETAQGVLQLPAGSALCRYRPLQGGLERLAAWPGGERALLCLDARDELAVTPGSGGAAFDLEQWAGFSGNPEGAPLAQTGREVAAAVCWASVVPRLGLTRDSLVLAETGARGSLRWAWAAPGLLPGWEWREPLFLVGPTEGFAPVALSTGPDGALYVLDRGGGKPGRERIWRIASERTGEHWGPATVDRPVWELLEALKEEPPGHRRHLRQELWARPREEVIAALEEAEQEPLPEKIRPKPELRDVLQLLLAQGAVDEGVLALAVHAPDPRTRVAAARAVAEWFGKLPGGEAWLRLLVEDEVEAVRLAALGSSRRLGGAMPEAGGSSAGGSAESRDATAEPSTEALASGELKPPSAAELWRRSEVPSGTLRRVAALLAERRGLSFTEFLLRVVEEKRASVPEWRNVQQLMAEADTGELHRATLRMREVVDAPASREARKAACAALVLAAASGGTLDRLVESVETQGDVAMAELLEGAACVAQHREARPLVREWLRRELESPSPENPCALSPAYLGGEERRQAALALQGVLEDKAAGKRSKSRR